MADDNNGADHKPYATNTLVKDGDIKILAWVGAGAMGVLVLFGLVLGQTGLLDFPDLPRSETLGDYYVDTLIYRERRTALALILRTFITGFSFVVGLALCTMGGLFILRQVTSLTTISGSLGDRGVGLMGGDPETAKSLKDSQFAFSSYSPGVMFMAGGVLVMGITQALAIPVRSIEIMPPNATAWCLTAEGSGYEICNGNLEAAGADLVPQPDPVPLVPEEQEPQPLATGE